MNNFLVNTNELTTKQWLFDCALAVAVFAFGVAQLLLTSTSVVIHDEGFRDMIGYVSVAPSFSAFVGLALMTLPLALRRKFSWPVYLFILVVFLGLQDVLRGYSLTMAGPMVALFTLASERTKTETAIATLLGGFGLLVVASPALNPSLALLVRVQNITSLVVAALAGYALKAYRSYLRATELRALAAEKSREEEAARRVEEERVRIAREIHDITAHSLSAVSVQAAVVQRMIDTDPEAAKEAIILVRKTAKDALEEIRSMIGVLREGTAPETAPTQGTDRLVDIVEYLQEASLNVTLDVTLFDKAQVPAYIDFALFGIAREAATNIVRHAHAKNVNIGLYSDTKRVGLLIEDDGDGTAEAGVGQGHGIQGMRERVNLLKGTFSSFDRRENGFVIRVEIPLTDKDTRR
ncbi:MAG: sensor histidine kinase [Raoultibacter sp.]